MGHTSRAMFRNAGFIPVLLVALMIVACQPLELPPVDEIPFSVDQLLATQDALPPGAITILPLRNSPLARLPAGTVSVTVRGQGSSVPGRLLELKWSKPSTTDSGGDDDSIAGFTPVHPSFPPPAPLTPSPPPTPPLPPRPPEPSEESPFTMLTWWQLAAQFILSGPAIGLEAGQELTLSSLALYLVPIVDPFSGSVLAGLAPSAIFNISPGATLRLVDVLVVVESNHLFQLVTRLCNQQQHWPYNTGVVIEGGALRIANLTTQVANGGGHVHWVNVTITRPLNAVGRPFNCAAKAITDGSQLGPVSRALLSEAWGFVYIYIAANLTLQPKDSWELVEINSKQVLVLLGDPTRPTTLDLGGRADVWGVTTSGTITIPTNPHGIAILSDLVVINLPHATRLNGAMSSLSIAMSSFNILRGVPFPETHGVLHVAQVRLVRCTVVVPDPELAFLAEAAGHNSSGIWPQEPPNGFVIQLQEPPRAPLKQLLRVDLSLLSEVSLSVCTLLSTSSYAQLPGAVPLLPRSLSWQPQLLADSDPQTFLRWGPGGLAVAPGLQEALISLASCGERLDYNPTRLITSHADTTIPAVGSEASVTFHISTDGALLPASTCAVDSVSEEVVGGRTFTDLKGGISRFGVVRPITLRNLVLYNLAPGGMYPEGKPAAPMLSYRDAAWRRSALPLWFFQCARSEEDVRQLAEDQRDASSPLPPRLVLEGVTLVVPEQEWRALAAVMLSHHAPQAMAEAQERRLKQRGEGDGQQQEHLGAPEPPDGVEAAESGQGPVPAAGPQYSDAASSGAAARPPSYGGSPRQRGQELDEPKYENASANGSVLGSGLKGEDGNVGRPQSGQHGASGSETPGAGEDEGVQPGEISDFDSSNIPGSGTSVRVYWNGDNGNGTVAGGTGPGTTVLGTMQGGRMPDGGSVPGGLPGSVAGDTSDSGSVPRAGEEERTPTEGQQQPGSLDGAMLGVGGTILDPLPAVPLGGPLAGAAIEPEGSANAGKGEEGGTEQGISATHPDDTAQGGRDDGVTSSAILPRQLRELRESTGSAEPSGAPLTPPLSPATPPPPPAPPYLATTRAALQAFAAESRMLSYDFSAGVLVLAAARHYGWTGTNVTMTYKLPQDAPPGARLLLYQRLALPYKELADMAIEFSLDFMPSSPPPPTTAPPAVPSRPPLEPRLTPLPPPPVQPLFASPEVYATKQHTAKDGSSDRAWVVPLVAFMAAIGGCLVLAAIVLCLVLAYRRSQRRKGCMAGSMRPRTDPRKSGWQAAADIAQVAIVCNGDDVDAAAGRAKEGCVVRAGGMMGSSTGQQLARSTTISSLVTTGSLVASTSISELNRCEVATVLNRVGASKTRPQDEARAHNAQPLSPTGAAGCQAPAVDEDSLLREMNAYFRELMAGTEPETLPPACPDGKLLLTGRRTPPVHRQHRYRDMSDAIHELQAELTDAELQVETVLDVGAFAVVYRGTWRGLQVAIKTLVVSEVMAGRGGPAQHRAVMEAAISMTLAHPNVVSTYSYNLKHLVQDPTGQPTGENSATGTTSTCSYEVGSHDVFKLCIVQEYCNGGTLRHALGQGVAGSVRAGGFAQAVALRLALDVALGMRHIHSCRIVHGDLKPDNVLLVTGPRAEPEGHQLDSAVLGGACTPEETIFLELTAKVADFGLSLPLAEGATHASHKFQGTPAYLAPEVASEGKLSPRADVWSFGLVLIELYYGCTLEEVRAIHSALQGSGQREGPQQPARALLLEDMMGSAHRPYAMVAAACLSMEPRERPDFDELVSRLQALCEGGGGGGDGY